MAIGSCRVGQLIMMDNGGYNGGFGSHRKAYGGVDLQSFMYSQDVDEHSISVLMYVNMHM